VGVEGDLLEPSRLSRQGSYMFSEPRDLRPAQQKFDASVTREVYDVAHPAPWGWKIAAYLWTKAIAAGVILVAATLVGRSGLLLGEIPSIVSPLIALVALGITGLLLIFDLKRPDRFYFLLTKPNLRSWLVIGAYILLVYGALCTAWLITGVLFHGVQGMLVGLTALFAAASACYSAFLFAQAKGRDLWQSPLFFWHLLVHALVAGSAVWLVATLYYRSHLSAQDASFASLAASLYMIDRAFVLLRFFLVLSLCMTLAELFMPHASEDARLASQNRIRGPLRARFWGLAIGAGLVLPILLLLGARDLPLNRGAGAELMAAAAILALAGVWWSEEAWVKAGQSVPLS
jgi:formate-dependent nitrite reductase membrane component NrfD